MHKSKEVLSANKETEFSLDGLINDIDFRGKVTRAEFEQMNAPLFAGIQSKIEVVMKTANLTKEDIAYIELIGGSSRVPKLQVNHSLVSAFLFDVTDHLLNVIGRVEEVFQPRDVGFPFERR
jgi:molecular chaperone DnaK (HSP70)